MRSLLSFVRIQSITPTLKKSVAKELVIYFTETQTVGDSPPVEVITHSIVRATPKSGNLPTYVRLHDLENGGTWIWSGDPYAVDENTSTDNPNWIPE